MFPPLLYFVLLFGLLLCFPLSIFPLPSPFTGGDVSFKSGLGSGRGGGSPQRRPQSPRQRLKPQCRSEAAFRRLCTPARHTPCKPQLSAGRSPAPSTATQAHRTHSYQPFSPLRTACFNSSRSWSSGWARARSKFRISPSRLGAGLGCCFIFSYRSRTAMGILPWHI